jgi:hypothetical protein
MMIVRARIMTSVLLSERLASLFVALLLLPAAAREPSAAPIAHPLGPELPGHAVFEPRFETPLGDLLAGTGFVIRAPGSGTAVLVTPHQPFTARAGLDRDYDGDELAGLIRAVEAYSVEDPARTLRARPGPAVAGAAATIAGSARRDVALFAVTEGADGALTLAETAPDNGQLVWLYARVGDDCAARLHRAVVEASTESALRYRFEDPNLDLRGARGAPVVDAAGRVVAMHVAEGLEDHYLRGTGNPVEAIRWTLAEASGLHAAQRDAIVSAR